MSSSRWSTRRLQLCHTAIRYLAMLALYAGFTAVIASVFLISHPPDVSKTCTTATYAPLLPVLFPRARTRAIQPTQDETDGTSCHVREVQVAMSNTVYAVLAPVILLPIISFVTREFPEHADEHGDVDISTGSSGGRAP